MSALVLIVEDESDLAATLSYNLQREGFTTRLATTGAEALQAAVLQPMPDLVLLDLMLPDMAGTEVCRRLRSGEATRELAVIMVTAKGEEIDRVVGFEVGADDYVVKPFSSRELLLRVRVALRRQPKVESSKRLKFNELVLDEAAHQAWLGERRLPLTVMEFRLLFILMLCQGQVQTRDRLLAELRSQSPEGSHRTVDKHIQRIRQKLGPAGHCIKTIRGVGYRLGDPGRLDFS
jgi:two-component system phosphate regulon response regulator PhoB